MPFSHESIIGLIGLAILIAAVVLTVALRKTKQKRRYMKTDYYRVTHLAYADVIRDKGRMGEYELYETLRAAAGKDAEFLFNVYLPKNETETTEIDVLMLESSGIWVFESKNYAGWIFGSDRKRKWTQALPVGRGKKAHTEHFLNPVWQNKLHVEALRKQLPASDLPVYPVVVFSNRCMFKDLRLRDPSSVVIKRGQIPDVLRERSRREKKALSKQEIRDLYKKLYPFTQVDEAVRQKHIADIQAALKEAAEQEAGDTDADTAQEGAPVGPESPDGTQASPQGSAPVVSEAPPEEVPAAFEPSAGTASFAVCAAYPADPDAGASALPVSADAGPENPDTPVSPSNKQQLAQTPSAPEQPPLCPRCGGQLILRTAAKGRNAGTRFYGCANFPRCRYTQAFGSKQDPA